MGEVKVNVTSKGSVTINMERVGQARDAERAAGRIPRATHLMGGTRPPEETEG